jgi:expansin (peptidoglycan-binding protein)
MGDLSPAPLCNSKIHAINTGSDDGVGGKGKSVTVTVKDTCTGCKRTHIDLSIGAWNHLTNNAPFGTVNLEWYFIEKND